MEARVSAAVFASLALWCATLTAQQVDYYQPDFRRGSPGRPRRRTISVKVSPLARCVPTRAAAARPRAIAASPGDCFRSATGGWNFYGWLDVGFVGNTTSPPSKFNGPYNAVDRANELMGNQLYFVAEKKLPGDCCCWGIGGRVDVLYGEDFFLAQSVGFENHDDGTPHWNDEFYGLAIPQAYVEVGRTDLSLKVGHFYSIIGYEGLPAVGNFFYSQGL